MSRTKEILKGCGSEDYMYICKYPNLCVECRSKLQERKLALEEMKEKLSDFVGYEGIKFDFWFDQIKAELKEHEAKA